MLTKKELDAERKEFDVEKKKFNVERKEFDVGGYRPKKCNGIRWISHKIAAMKMYLDKWGINIQHLEKLCQDQSTKTKERAKLKGYLTKWNDSKMLFFLTMCIDILEIASELSVSMQSDKTDTVNTIYFLSKTKDRLDLLKKKEFENTSKILDFESL